MRLKDILPIKNALYELLARFLTRNDNRALFGLLPLPADNPLRLPKSPVAKARPEEE